MKRARARILSLAREPEKALHAALETIQGGGVMLFPTESVYGMGVDATRPEAVERLYELKGRPREKPFQWLVPDLEFARAASKGWDERAEKLARAFWPGPLTLVVPVRGEQTVGWRVPHHDWLLKFLRRLNRPLAATSANPAEKPAPKIFRTALRPFADLVDLALDGGSIGRGAASTVVALEPSRIQILRPGAVSEPSIREAIAGGDFSSAVLEGYC